jgi:hypothetical protein
MTTKWLISNLECITDETNANIVTSVHWRLFATDTINGKLYRDELYGVTVLENLETKSFIQFEDLTETDVVNWLESCINVSDLMLSLTNRINAQANSPQLKPPF